MELNTKKIYRCKCYCTFYIRMIIILNPLMLNNFIKISITWMEIDFFMVFVFFLSRQRNALILIRMIILHIIQFKPFYSISFRSRNLHRTRPTHKIFPKHFHIIFISPNIIIINRPFPFYLLLLNNSLQSGSIIQYHLNMKKSKRNQCKS